MRGTLRVLVAEDNPDDFELVTRELKSAGFALVATRVDNAPAMARELESRTWDLVLSDWHMPGFGAAEAADVLRGKGVDLPFIIVSGTIGEDTAVEAMKCGAHDFLVKDKLARLVPAIERELKEAHNRRERRRMHDQLLISERMASVGLLAAGVAHEINNPLAAVLANLDLAQQDAVELTKGLADDRARELLDELSEARDAATRIRDIVRDLKLFSRSEEEKRTAVEVDRVLDSSARMAWNEIRHRAKLVKEYSPVPPVEANESRLGQVFLNLIVNATQAIPEGRASANTIRVATYLGVGGKVVIEVSDTGSGMPPEVLKRLFTPFFTTKPVGVGTGLGLSICHRIVSGLGGDISVDSTPGKGTTFRVSLPPAPLRREPTLPMEAQAGPAPRRGRVMVIDDEPAVCKAAGRILGSEHDVVTVSRAQDALVRLRGGETFDVILCDLMMPEMTGMELYAELVESMPAMAEKMVFLTGGAFTARARTFLDGVTNLRFEKPFDSTVLKSIVRERLR